VLKASKRRSEYGGARTVQGMELASLGSENGIGMHVTRELGQLGRGLRTVGDTRTGAAKAGSGNGDSGRAVCEHGQSARVGRGKEDS
jgi:hypothetical protein